MAYSKTKDISSNDDKDDRKAYRNPNSEPKYVEGFQIRTCGIISPQTSHDCLKSENIEPTVKSKNLKQDESDDVQLNEQKESKPDKVIKKEHKSIHSLNLNLDSSNNVGLRRRHSHENILIPRRAPFNRKIHSKLRQNVYSSLQTSSDEGNPNNLKRYIFNNRIQISAKMKKEEKLRKKVSRPIDKEELFYSSRHNFSSNSSSENTLYSNGEIYMSSAIKKGKKTHRRKYKARKISREEAAKKIQHFIRHRQHVGRVLLGLLSSKESIHKVCHMLMQMKSKKINYENASVYLRSSEFMKAASSTLQALRMNREASKISPSVRTTRAFVSFMIVHVTPNVTFQIGHETPLEKASNQIAKALMGLHQALLRSIDLKEVGSVLERRANDLIEARLLYCRQLESWKKLDGQRLADEMETALYTSIVSQLKAEKDPEDFLRRLESFKESQCEDLDKFSGPNKKVMIILNNLRKAVGVDETEKRLQRIFFKTQTFHSEKERFVKMKTGKGSVTSSNNSSKVWKGNKLLSRGSGGKAGRFARRAISASDLVQNEWVVHEIMIAKGSIQVDLEQSLENGLLDQNIGGYSKIYFNGKEPFWAEVSQGFEKGDYSLLISLMGTLRDRIISLTPRRKDLALETSNSMDVDLLLQMGMHGALDWEAYFQLIFFVGGRILDLEAPMRNDKTLQQIKDWKALKQKMNDAASFPGINFLRESIEYLLAKTDEIHVDIINVHLQMALPLILKHGVKIERENFTKKISNKENHLEFTKNWIYRSIDRIKKSESNIINESSSTMAKLISGLEEGRIEIYQEVIRCSILDGLIGKILNVDGDGVAKEFKEFDMDDIPETFEFDRSRILDIVTNIRLGAWCASLVALAKQAIGANNLNCAKYEEMLLARLFVLLDDEGVKREDIVNQVLEVCMIASAKSKLPLQAFSYESLTSQANAVVSNHCPVYRLYLRRILDAFRETALGTDNGQQMLFRKALSRKGLSCIYNFVEDGRILFGQLRQHNEDIFMPFYLDIIMHEINKHAYNIIMSID